MNFFVRRLEDELDAAGEILGRFLGADPAGLVPMPNATTGMNAVARGLPLEPGDEVLLTSHEYGAVRRVWQAVCDAAGARVTVAGIRAPLDDAGGVAADILAGLTANTKALVVSHVTSKDGGGVAGAVDLRRGEATRRAGGGGRAARGRRAAAGTGRRGDRRPRVRLVSGGVS